MLEIIATDRVVGPGAPGPWPSEKYEKLLLGGAAMIGWRGEKF